MVSQGYFSRLLNFYHSICANVLLKVDSDDKINSVAVWGSMGKMGKDKRFRLAKSVLWVIPLLALAVLAPLAFEVGAVGAG